MLSETPRAFSPKTLFSAQLRLSEEKCGRNIVKQAVAVY